MTAPEFAAMKAPPMPWIKRKMMSESSFHDSAHKRGRHDEDDESHLVHRHAAEHVTEAPHLGGDERDDEEIANDDPDDRGETDVEGSLDFGKCEHHDCGVNRGDEHASDDDEQREIGSCGESCAAFDRHVGRHLAARFHWWAGVFWVTLQSCARARTKRVERNMTPLRYA